MTRQEFFFLLERYKRQELSSEETAELMQEVSAGGFPAEVLEDILFSLRRKAGEENVASWTPAMEEEVLANLLRNARQRQKISGSLRRLQWPAIAASVLLCLFAAAFYFVRSSKLLHHDALADQINARAIKTQNKNNQAVLTLADGTTVTLNAENGVIQQGNATVHQRNGQLQYAVKGNSKEITYNTLTTPRGKQFEISFSDGSRVWLNSASSLRYPTVFDEKERVVELNGQGYFEIAKSASSPFKVKVNGVEVQVLGTHFDVMAYEDEGSVNTTLVEGQVSVSKGAALQILKPGEQAIAMKNKEDISVRTTDVSKVIAWKNGLFVFNDADISTILREIARWYDVQIVSDDNIENMHELFGGSISRNRDLSEVLRLLESAGTIHFKIQGNKVLVSR